MLFGEKKDLETNVESPIDMTADQYTNEFKEKEKHTPNAGEQVQLSSNIYYPSLT